MALCLVADMATLGQLCLKPKPAAACVTVSCGRHGNTEAAALPEAKACCCLCLVADMARLGQLCLKPKPAAACGTVSCGRHGNTEAALSEA